MVVGGRSCKSQTRCGALWLPCHVGFTGGVQGPDVTPGYIEVCVVHCTEKGLVNNYLYPLDLLLKYFQHMGSVPADFMA